MCACVRVCVCVCVCVCVIFLVNFFMFCLLVYITLFCIIMGNMVFL